MVGWPIEPCSGKVVITVVGDKTVGVAAAAAWKAPAVDVMPAEGGMPVATAANEPTDTCDVDRADIGLMKAVEP